MADRDCICSSPGEYGTTRNEKPATCTEAGWYEEICVECGGLVSSGTIAKIAHSYSWVQTTAPSCTETGVETYTCSGCGHSPNIQIIDALGHELLTEGDDPTCTEGGYKRETCQRDGCNYSSTTTLEALGHSVSSWTYIGPSCTTNAHYEGYCSTCKTTITKDEQEGTAEHTGLTAYGYKEATCTEAGANAGMMCTDCNTIITEPTEVAPLGHKEKSVSGKSATCTEAGYKASIVCERCKETLSGGEIIPATGHNMQVTEVVSATCQSGGYTIRGCINPNCTETDIVDETDPIAHNYATWIETVSSATCQTLAGNKYKCTMCDDTEIRYEGSYGDHVVKDNAWQYIGPTCTTDGYYSGTCSECGATVNGSVDEGSAAHPQASLEVIPAVAATCSSKGSTAGQKCNACGETIVQPVETAKDPSNHKEIPVPGKNATCTESGLTEGTKCEWCGAVLEVQEVIDAYKHLETETITKVPGPGVQGEKTYTCTRCGATRTEILPAAPLVQYIVTINHVRKDNNELITSIDTSFSDGTTCEILDYKYEPVGYEFDEESAPSDFPVTQNTAITLYYYKLATIITNHYAKNQSQTLLGSNINEGNRFRVGTEIDLSQFANTYTNYTYSDNSGVSSDNELYIIQDGTNEINYFYNPSFETTYTITCNYYKGLVADESLLYTSKEYSGLAPNSTFDPSEKIIVVPGYDYYSCTETDPFAVTVNKSVDYFYKEAKSYTLTVYHEDIDNKGMSIATAVPHYGIREGAAINPADYQLTGEYLPEGWMYVEGTSIDKLTQNSSITCYYKKTTQSFIIHKKSVYNGKEISESIKKPQGTNIPDTKTLFNKHIKDGIDEYTLDKTKPAAIENLSSNMEVIATYRGYYGYKIKYVYLNTDTNTYVDIQSPEEMVYQSTSQWRFNEDGTAPEIKGFVSTGKVRINEDYEEKIEPLGIITLGSEETIIEYLYTPASKIIIQFVDYYTNKSFKTENVEAKNPFVVPTSKKNEILDNGYRVNGVKINDDTDVDFGGSYTLDLSKLNVITYLCIPAFTNFNDKTVKTGETISIKYDLYRNNLTPTYTISQDGIVLSVAKNETDISLLAYNAGTATLTITLGNYTETHTYTVQYKDTPQSIALGVGLTTELSYRESEHILDYDGELCANISHPDDTYILTGTKKQLLQQIITVSNKNPEYIITKLYITCVEIIYKVTYQYKNEATGQSIKSSRSESFAKGQEVVINLNSPLYFIEGYQLVAVEKDGEKTNDNIEFTLEADTTVTLWYKITTHTHNFDTKVRTVAPSCVTQGYELWSCSCGETQQKNIIAALDHNWSGWIVTIEPTETAPGQETNTCSRCGTKENRTKDAIGVPVEEIDSNIILLRSNKRSYSPTTTYDMIIVSKTNTNKLINVGAAVPSTLSEGSIYIEGGISVNSNLNSGWLRRIKDNTNRRISPKTTVDLIVLNQNNAQAFIVRSYAPVGTPGPAGTLYFVTGE